jgi:hypothetical protein
MFHRPKGDSPAEQRKKYEAHKTANEAVKQLRACKQYFTSFVIAFALLEDRLRALDFVAIHQGIVPPPKNVRQTQNWKEIVQRLHSSTLIELDLRNELMNLVDMRNKAIHSAHYNLNSVIDAHVKRVVEAQRKVAKLVRKLIKGGSLKRREDQQIRPRRTNKFGAS